MPDIWSIFTRQSDAVRWGVTGLGGLAVLAGAGYAIWRVFRREVSPEELERLRREKIHHTGKIGDGEIVDVDGSVILYS